MRLFISLRPKMVGGGANTFAFNLWNWAKKNGIRLSANIMNADRAVIIAHNADIELVKKARQKGCYMVHRLDEYFQDDEDGYRKQKHQKIIELNQYADITIFQSKFVFDNVFPYLNCKRHDIILNGADANRFSAPQEPGEFIGHVTWGIGDIKRLDLVQRFVQYHPDEKFLLIGNHCRSKVNFRQFKNIKIAGRVARRKLPHFYKMMKMLYFPSEREPCPNIPIEAILCGVPVCYNEYGGTKEIVRDCGLPLAQAEELLQDLSVFRQRCLGRKDLYFDQVARQYMSA